ncbi:MAG: retron system putative HNH endonuclease [Methylococcales bacterium]|nr:retron system putative HNH endonuclease [Methylococcales bacterium]
MRFIGKSKRCDEFDTYIKDNVQLLSSTGKWNLPTDIKTKLHNDILKQQQGLCIYCQQELPEKENAQYLPESIIEHLRPRTKYPELTHIFCNLSVACKKHKQKKDKKELIDFCEDRKDEEYDEDKFLNPHELVDIETYFEYDTEGNIFAHQ